MIDNFRLDVVAKGERALRLALDLALLDRGPVVAWREDPDHGLVLYATRADGATPLPEKASTNEVAVLVRSWLDGRDYRPRPDMDGHPTYGWRLYTNEWGHVAGDPRTLLAVQPRWALIGK